MPEIQTRQLVQSFYDDVWNRWDKATAHDILAADFSFRGSLGTATVGVDGFLGYVRSIRAAFPDFHNEIENLIVEGDNAAARLGRKLINEMRNGARNGNKMQGER